LISWNLDSLDIDAKKKSGKKKAKEIGSKKGRAKINVNMGSTNESLDDGTLYIKNVLK
jgi:hypothetical protein